jgi:hypothetical protein
MVLRNVATEEEQRKRISKSEAWRCDCNEMARPERFELPTYGFVDHRSIQLSYGRAVLEMRKTEATPV